MGPWGDGCRWCGHCEELSFFLSLEGAVLRGAKGWGLAFGNTCLGTELILGFPAGNTPSYMSPQAG